ncbi:ribonuclease III [Vallitaleaceae bacterium 9-2]
MKYKKLHEFESVISYPFENMKLLIQSLTHSSYANEHNLKKIENNERLEFLGDAVLEIVTSDYLYRKYPDNLEGELTKLRASLVCEPTLATFAREISLGSYLLLGKGEDASGGRERDSVLSDTVEALIGAIYLDGGIDKARTFIERTLLSDIPSRQRFVDSKTQLQEYIQQFSEQPIEYRVMSETGPDHDKHFEVHVYHNEAVVGQGSGRSKKSAEQSAAMDALSKIENK